MSEAKVWKITLNGIPCQANGKKEKKVWARAMYYAIHAAKKIEFEATQQKDSMLTLTFKDNSKLRVWDPNQEYNPGVAICG